jgi:hypothetical protein
MGARVRNQNFSAEFPQRWLTIKDAATNAALIDFGVSASLTWQPDLRRNYGTAETSLPTGLASTVRSGYSEGTRITEDFKIAQDHDEKCVGIG